SQTLVFLRGLTAICCRSPVRDSNTGRSAARRQLATVRRSSAGLGSLVAGTLGAVVAARLSRRKRRERSGNHRYAAHVTRPLGFLFAGTLGVVPFAGDLREHQLQPFR